MSYATKLAQYRKDGLLNDELSQVLEGWYSSYKKAAHLNKYPEDRVEAILEQYLDLVAQEIKQPFKFDSYHQLLSKPHDFYQLGLEFARPLIMMDKSAIFHEDQVERIAKQISAGENVVLLANHQTEFDPQAISLLLEKKHPKLAREMIFVAGHRVTTDPMAIPFSKGRNLLCIYSKKYINDDPVRKEEKIRHNQRTLKCMSELLSEGGHCIYVAPSGGRDRPGPSKKVEVAAFDPDSIELFWLVSQKATKPTHFYPLALATYKLLPPPDKIKKKIGEPRYTFATPIYLSFGPEIDMTMSNEKLPANKKESRQLKAKKIQEKVCELYLDLNYD